MSDDQMAPEASPGELNKKSGVRRVNNMPMFLIGGALGIFLLVMAVVAMDRANKQNQPPEPEEETAGSTSLFADEIAGSSEDGVIQAAPLVPPQDDLEQVPTESPVADPAESPTITVARPANLDEPPVPPSGLRQEEIDRIRMAKLQMLEEAVRARTGVRIDAPRSSGSAMAASDTPSSRDEMLARIADARRRAQDVMSDDPTAAYKTRLEQMQSAGLAGGPGIGGDGPPTLLPSTSGDTGGGNFAAFDKRGGGDRWQLNSQPEAPRSPYELRAGFVIPATLISGVNSDLPGQIMAQVSQNVYDTPTGKHVLIPQGSRLVGSYDSEVIYGQKRVLIAWQRIVFPDGKAMDIGSMPGADSAGYSGFRDKVNNHYWRVFSSAFLMSGVVAGVSLSQDNDSSSTGDRQRASDAMSEALGQVLGQTIAQVIAKNLNIAPTLEIRPGYRFNVIVTKDMTFSKPYQSFDY